MPEGGPPRQRSWWEVRWRQFRNAPRPVVRAVVSSLIVAVVAGGIYLLYDIAITLGADLPGGDLRTLAVLVYVLAVMTAGSLATWYLVPLPSGSGSRVTRTPWAAALGLFAAIPIAYLVLVVAVQVIKPIVT